MRSPDLMNLALLTLGLFLFSGCVSMPLPDFDNRATLGNADKYFAFVGEKIRVSQFDPAEDDPKDADPDTIIIHMDAAFKARYRVLEVVHGDYEKQTIDFKAYDHYGYPHFAEQEYALVYVREYDGELFHVKYTYDTVYPTANDRFAGCGDPYLEIEDEKFIRRPLETIEFSPPIKLRISDYKIPKKDRKEYDAEELAEDDAKVQAFFSPPAFDVRGDYATCRMGAYADELFRITWETQLYRFDASQ